MPSSGAITGGNMLPDGDHKSLPESYGGTEAALLPRDPNWMFVYWDISAEARAKLAREHGADIFGKGRQVMRVYRVAEEDGGKEGEYFDVPVMLEARSWYVNVKESGKAYRCELGLLLPGGRFLGIVKTNAVRLPPGRVSDATDEKWMAVSPDFDRLLQLSGVEYIGKGSGEVAKSLAQRWEMLRAVFSRAASWGVSSISSMARHRAPEARGFWLLADCELVLYGATEPGSSVTVAGRKIGLGPDGTFSMRVALPDGETDLPVEAVSKDGADRRRVRITVGRKTDAGARRAGDEREAAAAGIRQAYAAR